MGEKYVKNRKNCVNFKINIEIILGICYLNIDEL